MNEPLRPWKTEVLLPLALVLLLLAPPAASREQASSDPDPSPALSPKIETRILQRNETLLQSEVRVLPGGDPGRVLWTRIDVSDSKGETSTVQDFRRRHRSPCRATRRAGLR